jgi:hypothetical protein
MPRRYKSAAYDPDLAFAPRRPNENGVGSDNGGRDEGFVQVSRSVIGQMQDVIQRIGRAIIGGDFTGAGRGDGALDFQTSRGDPAQVAAGAQSIAIGAENTAATDLTIALGRHNTASSANPLHGGIAIGADNTALGEDAVALGANCLAGSHRTVAVGDTAVAADDFALALGTLASAGGAKSIAVGVQASTAALTGAGSLAVGAGAHATAENAAALGNAAHALAARALALGNGARARLADSVNLAGAILVRRGTLVGDEDVEGGGAVPARHFCGAEDVILSATVDMKAIQDITVTLTTGCRIWVNEVGVIAVACTGCTGQPTLRFGVAGNASKHLAARLTTLLTSLGARERYHPLTWSDGETVLTAGVTAGATAATLLGRFYWKGTLVEDEAA